MSTTEKQRALQVVQRKQGVGANSLLEASRMRQCLDLCTMLGIEDFEMSGLVKLVDRRPMLQDYECLVMKLLKPDYFLVVGPREAYISPLIGIGEDIIWSYEQEAKKYEQTPERMSKSNMTIIPIRSGFTEELNGNNNHETSY